MQTKDHIRYNSYLYELTGIRMKGYRRFFFELGTYLPDFNYLSYLRGARWGAFIYGHNMPEALAFLLKKLERLENSREKRFHTPLYYYNLGLAMHYLADAFTHVHNASFKGVMKEHNAYEEEMHRVFEEGLEENRRLWAEGPDHTCPLKTYFQALHEEYSSLPPCQKTDLGYMTRVTANIYSYLVRDLLHDEVC